MPKNQPLEVGVVDGELRIRVGITTLKNACEKSPDNRLCWMDEGSETARFVSYKVLDEERFAKDVANELEREEEDGTTPVHTLLDNAMVAALENGSLAISDEPSETDFK